MKRMTETWPKGGVRYIIHPPGDSLERLGIYQSIANGVIPILTHTEQAESLPF